MDRRVFDNNDYTVRIPLTERASSGASTTAPARALTVNAYFAAAKGGAAIGLTHGIVLTEDPATPGLYGGIITGAGIHTDLFSNGANLDEQFVWLRLVDPATRLDLSLRRTAYANR